jgi:hypothetical protein
MPDRDLPNLGRGRSVADRRQGCAHSSRTSLSAKSPLPTRRRLGLFRSCHPILSTGWRKPPSACWRSGGSGPPVHRGAHHQRPSGARVLRLRATCRPVRGRSGRSGCMVVSRRQAEGHLRSLGRFARQLTTRISFSSKLTRPLPGAAHPAAPATTSHRRCTSPTDRSRRAVSRRKAATSGARIIAARPPGSRRPSRRRASRPERDG